MCAGAGMGVDSGLPDYRGPEGFWRAYPPYRALGLRFEELADEYRTYLDARTQKLRRRLQAMPISPSLNTPANSPRKPEAGRARKAAAAKGRKRQ